MLYFNHKPVKEWQHCGEVAAAPAAAESAECAALLEERPLSPSSILRERAKVLIILCGDVNIMLFTLKSFCSRLVPDS